VSIIRPSGQGAAQPRVVVVGAGFAGLSALHVLRRSSASVTLVDRNAYSTFQPLLYQVATAGLTSADVAYSLFAVARKHRASFRLGEVTGIDTAARRALLADGTSLAYDYLIIASGVAASYFGIPGAAEHSFGLYTRRDAVALRNQLMAELERRSNPAAPGGDADLNITIVGGGATGVELAGTVAELRNIALPAAFPLIDAVRMRVRLVEQAPALIAPFSPSLRDYARHQLLARGVDVRLETSIKEVGADFVLLADGSRLPSDLTVWAAGVSAPLEGLPGLPRGRGGRLQTGQDLRIAGQERVFAAGDVALTGDQPIAQLAQPAIQQGRHAAEQIGRLESGQDTLPFSYHDKGIMATIGRRSAVVQLPYRVRVRGSLAWLAWLGLHLITLLGNRNRLAVLVNLSWRYISWKRSGGIVIGDDLPRARR
jgi:NADH dehydrogenase